MSKNKINISIDKDDVNINDYLYCWSEFGERPNKISLYNHYDPESFMGILSGFSYSSCGTITDVIPTGDDYLVNERSLIKLNDDIYVSFSQFDKLTDSKIISDVNFLYNSKAGESFGEILTKLDEIVVDYLDEDSQERFNTVLIGQNGIEMESINLLPTDYDNIDLYYNDEVMKSTKKVIKSIKKSNKGLSIIFGQRGTGKTNLINHIVSNLEKIVIFIPSTMIDHTINNPDFLTLIKRYQNSIIVIDDCETLFTDIYRKSTLFVNNLLQLIDGYQSDLFNLNVILSLNIDEEELYDKTLLDCNNLLGIIEVDELSNIKVKDLCNHLGHKSKSKSKMRVIDVVNKDWTKDTDINVGFN